MAKYVYEPAENRFTPGFKVGHEYEGNFKDHPNFKPVKEKKEDKKDDKKGSK